MTELAHGVEEAIRQRCLAGDLHGAMTVAFRGYGKELGRWLRRAVGDDDAARDLFGAVMEEIWLGLPSFRGDGSFRAWAYSIARHRVARFFRSVARRQAREQSSDVALAERARLSTQPWLRTDVKQAFARVRNRLTMEERLLLRLRVDRGLSWSEIARQLSAAPSSEVAAQRQAAAVRQRFTRLKQRLRRLAAEEGLFVAEPRAQRSRAR